MFQEQARQKRFDIETLMGCKLQEGANFSVHVLNKSYIDKLESLHFSFGQGLATDIVINLLTGSYNQFILSFNINNI